LLSIPFKEKKNWFCYCLYKFFYRC